VGEKEGGGGKAGDGGKGGEMTQILYAHMNKEILKKSKQIIFSVHPGN
jgi:hypothetical protein